MKTNTIFTDNANKENGVFYKVSVVINYFDNLDSLKQTIECIEKQTLSEKYIQILIKIRSKNDIDEIKKIKLNHTNIYFLENEDNVFKNIKSPYFIFVSSGDLFSYTYFKNAILMFKTQKNIGWVYCNNNKEYFTKDDKKMTSFSLKKQLSSTQSPSIFRTDLFNNKNIQDDGKKSKIILQLEFKLKFLALGYYGEKDSQSSYFEKIINIKSDETEDSIFLNKIILYRKNIFTFIKILRVKKIFNENIKNDGKKIKKYSSNLLNKLFGRIVSAFLGIKVNSLSPLFLFYYIFKIESFKREFFNRKKLFTKAEFSIFKEKPYTDNLTALKEKNLSKSIIFAHQFWNEGGSERVLKEWMSSARKSCYFDKIIDIVDSSSKETSLLEDEFGYIANEQYSLDCLFITNHERLKFCWELIVDERPKVIFIMSNSYFYILTPIIKKFFPDIKIVDLLHNEYFFNSAWFGISSEYNKYIDKRIVISKHWKNVLSEKYNEDPDKIVVANNFVDLERFDPEKFDSDKIKKENGISLDKKIITFIGRINKQKNIDTFLKLAESMCGNTDFEFIVLGNNDDSKEYVDEIIKNINNIQNIKNFNHKFNIEEFIKISNVLVLPSLFEGYPLISLEAAAMNTPVIVPNIVGFREQIQEGGFGILYESKGSKLDCIQIKEILINNFEYLEKIALRGRSFVTKNHSLTDQSIKYKEIIENL